MPMLIPQHRTMNRSRMLRFLNEVEAATGPATSLYIPADFSASELQKAFEILPGEGEAPPDLAERITKSKTGAILFWGQTHRCLVLPPFPIGERRVSPGYDVGALRSLLGRDLLIALILVRLGDYAIGVFEGEKRLSSKVGTGLVHGRHRQGGSSAQRFERHREKQMEMFFTRVCAHAREHLEPHGRKIDHVIYGGERFTLLKFRKQCHFLTTFDDRTMESILNVRAPRQATLEESIADVWSSSLTEWIENN
ncbi:MAG: Vms1/Ankzf1 family peptidyl-tRNA hydrolase [Dehalococcoidia bacterium]|nr:Vms1/Ankzf1 family peptidyl-tRNA hydrolase [Dehalococcoidia bacterium]